MPRDQAIFEMIGRRGAASLESIVRGHWATSSIQNCQARLDQLVRGGYLTRERVDVRETSELIYLLARRARSLFSATTKEGFYKKPPSATELRHVLYLGDVLDRFGPSVVEFINEHQLKSRKMVIGESGEEEVPDGWVRLARSDGSQMCCYIEIDGAYHGDRLASKIASLSQSDAPVVWVAFSSKRLAHLQSAMRGVESIHPILYDHVGRI